MLPAIAALTLGLQLPPGPTITAHDAFPDSRPLTHFVQNLVRDVAAVPRVTSLQILAIGGGAAFAAHRGDERAAAWAVESGASTLSTGGGLGEAWIQGIGALAAYGAGRISGHAKLTHVGGDLIRAQALNGLFTSALKVAVDRQRPNGGQYAFPSGHTSAAFTSATVIQAHSRPIVGVAAFVTAGFIGFTRVRDNKHWASDVVFGAALGVMSGRTVAGPHDERTWHFVPVRTDGGAALYVVINR